jgi:hypothetical protein
MYFTYGIKKYCQHHYVYFQHVFVEVIKVPPDIEYQIPHGTVKTEYKI